MTSQARQRHLAKKAGSTRHVAPHEEQMNTITITVTKPFNVREPTIFRSRRPWICSVLQPHRHSDGRYAPGVRIRASCPAASTTDSSMSVPPFCPLDA
jgi:hypothetical protein